MKIPTDDPDWAPELYEARAMRPARRLSRSRAFSKSNGTTAPRGAWQSKPFTMADGNPGSRRWCIPSHSLSLASVGDFHGIIASAANRRFEIVIKGFLLERE
jgi:hypothetical protein